MELCSVCGAFLLEDEIDNTIEDLCFDCCEEHHLANETICTSLGCPYSKCNAKKGEKE